MLFEKAYDVLEKFDEDEKVAYDYYKETKKFLTYSELNYLMRLNNPRDFSKLNSVDFKKQFEEKYSGDVSMVIADRDAIPEGRNLIIKSYRDMQ